MDITNFPGEFRERELIRSCLKASMDVLFQDASAIIHAYLPPDSVMSALSLLHMRCHTLLDARARYHESEAVHQPARLARLYEDTQRELNAWYKAVEASGLKGDHGPFLARFGTAMQQLVCHAVTGEEALYLHAVATGLFSNPVDYDTPDEEAVLNVTHHAPLQDGLMGSPRIMRPFLELSEHESIAANMYRYGSIFTP